ncbi:hypothetical protein YC2023_065596 [Brassica napus]
MDVCLCIKKLKVFHGSLTPSARERECIIVLDLVVGTIHTREKISWYSVLAIEEVFEHMVTYVVLNGDG